MAQTPKPKPPALMPATEEGGKGKKKLTPQEEFEQELKRMKEVYSVSEAETTYIKEWEEKRDEYRSRHKLGIIALFFVSGIGFLAFAAELIFLGRSAPEEMSMLSIVTHALAGFLLLLAFLGPLMYFLKSIKTVSTDEIALKEFLGAPIDIDNPGPHVLFAKLMEHRKETAQLRQRQHPTESENLSYEDEGKESEGKKQPYRVPLLGPEGAEETNDPWKKRRTVGISYSISLGVNTNKPLEFFRLTGTLDAAHAWAADIAQGLYAKVLSRENLDTIYRNMSFINEQLRQYTELLLGPRGVRVFRVELVVVDLGKSFNTLIQAEADALLRKTAAIVDAEAKKATDILDGEAQGEIRKILAAADAFGYRTIAEALEMKEKEVVLLVESMKNVLKDADNTVLLGVDGVKDVLMGAMTLMKGMGVGGGK